MGIRPRPRANGERAIDAPRRLRAGVPDTGPAPIRDGAPHRRADAVREAAADPAIDPGPPPARGPDPMPVGPLRRWPRGDAARRHRRAAAEDPIRRVAALGAAVDRNPRTVADRRRVGDPPDPEGEKPRFSG